LINQGVLGQTHTIGLTYTQPVVVDLKIPNGNGIFVVTGLLNGVTSSETITFTGDAPGRKITSKSWTELLSLEATSGTASYVTASVQGRSGQPTMTEATVQVGVPARFENIGPGTPFFSPVGEQKPDEAICYIACNEEFVLVNDIIVPEAGDPPWVLDVSMLDVDTGLSIGLTKKYRVLDIDVYYNRVKYVYSVLKIAKIQ